VRGWADLGFHPVGPRHQFVGVEHVLQGQHPFQMLGLGEVGGETRAADQLGRRVGHPQLGVAVFQGEEFVEQRIEVGVGDDRRVLDVVAELVFAHLVGKLLPAPPHGRVDRIGFRIAGGRFWGHPRRLVDRADNASTCRWRHRMRLDDDVPAGSTAARNPPDETVDFATDGRTRRLSA
jgi:hypothetical protein